MNQPKLHCDCSGLVQPVPEPQPGRAEPRMAVEAFTAGPWEWTAKNDNGDLPVLTGANGAVVCHFGNCETYYPTEGAEPEEADRALISAAPDLYAALAAILSCVNGEGWTLEETKVCVASHARTALAKAQPAKNPLTGPQGEAS